MFPKHFLPDCTSVIHIIGSRADCYHDPIIFKFISLNTHAPDVGYKGFDMDYDTQPCLRQMIF